MRKARMRKQRGVTLIEYGLIAALIAVVVVASLTAIGTTLDATYVAIGAAL